MEPQLEGDHSRECALTKHSVGCRELASVSTDNPRLINIEVTRAIQEQQETGLEINNIKLKSA